MSTAGRDAPRERDDEMLWRQVNTSADSCRKLAQRLHDHEARLRTLEAFMERLQGALKEPKPYEDNDE